jgi:UDP-glucose:glycoprotein glucosyltransferase
MYLFRLQSSEKKPWLNLPCFQISQFDFQRPVMSANVDWNLVLSEFKTLMAEEGLDTDLISIISGKQDGTEEMIQRAQAYTARLGADLASAPQGHVFVNGKHFDLDDVSLIFSFSCLYMANS